MLKTINIYCDESCHLQNDMSNVMVLGGLSCPKDRRKSVTKEIRELKSQYKIPQQFEVKWVKVSPAQENFYLSLIDYFFNNNNLRFRALIIPDKQKLDHTKFNQTHDDWYYKMYFDMLKSILNPAQFAYNIYIDYKDTHGNKKVNKLHNVLANANYDFKRESISKIQLIRSDETELLPLADILIGAVCYANRGISTSIAKLHIIERLRERSGFSLTRSTLLGEKKLNIFKWAAS